MPKHTGLNRVSTDQFYTNKKAVDLCLDTLKTTVKIRQNDLIIEPSAGNGAFIDGIKSLCPNYLFYDIEPKNDEVVEQDFLKLAFEDIHAKNIHFLGNPPFGRQSSLAIKFIKKASEKAKTISFILPKSFKKDSMKAHFPNNFWLLKEIDLPEGSFTVNDKIHDVPCVFQVWKKRRKQRPKPEKLIPEKFKFVTKENSPDIAVRRVGVNAGRIIEEKTDIDKASVQSHYFITFESRDLKTILPSLRQISFEHDNTAGPRSISKQELLGKYNEVLG